MTVTNREKRCDVRTSHILSVACNLINKRNAVESKFSTSPDSRRAKNVGGDYSPMTLPTPEDSTASWLDAEDSYQATDFLDEASRILHDEEDFSDACHDRLRSEYKQWKRIPHLRVIGKRIEYSCEKTLEDDKQSCQVDSRPSTANNRDLDLLRNQVIKIMTETLWQRILDKTSIKSVCQRQSVLESRRNSSGRIESALIVSSILPANRPSIMFKSRSNLETVNKTCSGLVCQQKNNKEYRKKPWPKSNVNILPPIETHQMNTVDKKKRWFSAVSTPGRNHALPRPVTSVATHVNTSINVCFGISIDGKSIKSLKKKGYCSPS
ncbi:uncharacterized protein LOC100570824 isoform X1 [Acyrthosiphon pisum]|uniref:Uncharacterized protein n=1 Tax=Acyrthosiphon pisum TaxID=7029 RepID=A0A8R2AD05_ACYPI|nr:uncharacterized protein LOC100570824 isoform X1 [Acyrthosiphon pisum]|eukprot:XP_003247147.2 PREDICTED: uncharacterized protein LOC100570824 [Acyrthosiphon pisum]